MKHFGYYLTLGDQAKKTADHVTLYWTGIKPQWQSLDEVTKLTTSGKTMVLDVESSIFERSPSAQTPPSACAICERTSPRTATCPRST